MRENDVRESLDGSSGDEHGFRCLRSGEKLTPLAGEQYNLFSLAAGTKILSNFLERPTETPGRVECTKVQHRVIALFDSAMILLDPPI